MKKIALDACMFFSIFHMYEMLKTASKDNNIEPTNQNLDMLLQDFIKKTNAKNHLDIYMSCQILSSILKEEVCPCFTMINIREIYAHTKKNPNRPKWYCIDRNLVDDFMKTYANLLVITDERVLKDVYDLSNLYMQRKQKGQISRFTPMTCEINGN